MVEKNFMGLEMGVCIQIIQITILKMMIIDPYISIKNNEARIGLVHLMIGSF